MTERKYALTKVAPGDYLLPSNDAKTIWRISQYTDGPSAGLDWTHDRVLWGYWRWRHPAHGTVDVEDWAEWERWGDGYGRRKDAIDAALKT